MFDDINNLIITEKNKLRKKSKDFIENACNELEGNLDCIINNAGVTQDNLAIRMTLEEWQFLMLLTINI